MLDFIEIILLVLIAYFLVTKSEGRLAIKKSRRIILDSCALIDGRIVELVNSGFVADDLIIPQFILNELQLLADGNDSHKRERARFGLDIAHQLQDSSPANVTVDRTLITAEMAQATDDKLVFLARKINAALYTTDYNLGKVAAVEGVKVLNVNEVAGALRPITLPGETLNIKIIQKGSGRDQGVGYLDDGTMIVVDGASKYIGKIMPVIVTRMHQTVAGKMVFGQIKQGSETFGGESSRRQPSAQTQGRSQTSAPKLNIKPAVAKPSARKASNNRIQNRFRSSGNGSRVASLRHLQ